MDILGNYIATVIHSKFIQFPITVHVLFVPKRRNYQEFIRILTFFLTKDQASNDCNQFVPNIITQFAKSNMFLFK